MAAIDQLRIALRHMRWADEELVAAVLSASDADLAARELAHVIGATEVWLARLQGRESSLAVWPDARATELANMSRRLYDAFDAYLAALSDADLDATVSYRNTKGQPFTNTRSDILMHVLLHAQYHRGKINLLLRQGGGAPAPVDYISFIRGAPAATTAPPLR